MTLLGAALGSNGLGCAPGAFFFEDYDTPIREQQAAVTVRYTRADQQSAVAVEPLRLPVLLRALTVQLPQRPLSLFPQLPL